VDLLETLGELSLLARGRELTAEERTALAGVDVDGARRFAAALATDPAVARQALPVFFPWASGWLGIRHFPLSTATTASGKPYLYWEKPCAEKDLVRATPWWDRGSSVLICRDNYRPERPFDSTVGYMCQPTMPGCGCGPYLLACSPDDPTETQLRLSLRAELADTVAHLVEQRAPLRELFVSNATRRDRRAELWYRTARVLAGEPVAQVFAGYDAWPDTPIWAPRPERVPGQEAGLLTTAHMLWQEQGPRERMQLYHQTLWCVDSRSVKVTTEQIFGLGVTDFRERRDEGLRLAETPVCDTCHARLDHSLEFFAAHEKHAFIAPRDPARKAKLFFHDRDDLRGEDVALPGGFARLATAVPEFGHCMSRRVVDHVLGTEAASDDYRAVHDAFTKSGDYQSLLRVALERLLEHRLRRAAPASAVAASAAGSEPLPALLRTHCADCHDGDAPAGGVDLARAALPPPVLKQALDEVSAGRMPKSFPPLGHAERASLIDALIAAWPRPDEQPGLRQVFAGQMHALPTLPPHVLQQVVHDRVGLDGDPDTWAIPSPYSQLGRAHMQLTPDLLLFMTTQAVKSCKQKPRAGEDLAACADRATGGLAKP
jgi:mono/diheme cytochrome c family protein